MQKRSPGWGFGSTPRSLGLSCEGSNSKEKTSPFGQSGQMDSMSFSRSPRYGFGSAPRALRIPGGVAAPPDHDRGDPKSKGRKPGDDASSFRSTSSCMTGPSFTVPPPWRELAGDRQLMSPGPGSYTCYPQEAVTRLRGGFGSAARWVVGLRTTTPGKRMSGALETSGRCLQDTRST
ncbi:unnamed protein product [Polarella glacialis]|uniref:Uncharacterized protein n=1 Tax=Polarella glacialis TaxID=89957 RepID=A0A813JU35_POLGL|nr:unnamed protein product [Polarella glacialis]